MANPISNDEMRLNGLPFAVIRDVNCSIGIYSSPKTTNRRISYNILILPLNQLLNNIPAKIVDIPIHNKVIDPDTKSSRISLFVSIECIPL